METIPYGKVSTSSSLSGGHPKNDTWEPTEFVIVKQTPRTGMGNLVLWWLQKWLSPK